MSLLSHCAKAGRTIIKTTQNPQVVAVWASFLHSSGLNIAQQRSADGWILPIPARKACKSIPSSVTEQKEAERNIWPPSSPDSLSQITQQHFHRWCLVCRGFNCFTHFFWKDWQLHTLCCTCSDEPVKTGVYSVPLILQIFFPTLSSVLLYMRFCVFQEKEVTHLLCWTFPPCFSSASRSWCHSWTPGSQKGAKKNQIKHMKDL